MTKSYTRPNPPSVEDPDHVPENRPMLIAAALFTIALIIYGIVEFV